MTTLRVFLVAVGCVAGVAGAVQLLAQGPADVAHAVAWLAAGVLAHDAVLAPAVVVAGLVVWPRLPEPARAPAAVAAVVVGTVTLAVLPTLGRFGAKPDDETLLNRPYVAFWVGLVLLAALGALVASVVRRRQRRT